MDPSSQPNVENRFPDCVAMKLHCQAKTETPQTSPLIGVSPTTATADPKEIDFSLTIVFGGEQEIEVPGGKRLGLPGGRAKFGIKRGKLRFNLEKCKLPLEKITLSNPLKPSILVERQNTRSGELQAGIAATSSLGIKGTQGVTEKATQEFFQVKKVGSEEKPSWIFEAYDARTVLEGTLTEALLGTLEINEFPCAVTADFTAQGDDIRLTGGQIGQAKDIHRNKLAQIERAIALRYIKQIVEAAPICQGRWRHG